LLVLTVVAYLFEREGGEKKRRKEEELKKI
jgi:hypothetical protein